MRSDITPGGLFPDYELPDHTNVRRRLSELQGGDPLILTLAPGHYCPKEHQQHLELAAFFPRIAVAYTQVATITTDEHHELQEFRASVGAQWTFLSDPAASSNRTLDIKEYTDPDHDPMISHTLALNQGSSSTASITATGSGAGLRSPTSGTTYGLSPATFAPTGPAALQGCRTPGIRATSPASTAGIGVPPGHRALDGRLRRLAPSRPARTPRRWRSTSPAANTCKYAARASRLRQPRAGWRRGGRCACRR